jgi:N-acetylneuraminic acid mutarotase
MRSEKRRLMLLSGIVLLLVFMLSCLAVYAEGADTWTPKASMAEKREYPEVAVVNGKIYVIGGHNSTGYLNSVEEYDPSTDTWSTKAYMAEKRGGHQTTVVNGKIYAIGGYDAANSFTSVEGYDPATDRWTAKASMAQKRSLLGVAVVSGKIYAIGGHNSTGYLNSVEEYDPATNTWTTKASMVENRGEYQVAVVNGKIYAIGGRNSTGYLNSVEEYDPATNTWATKASMAEKRSLHQVAVVNGKIYVIGGHGSTGYLNSIEEYDPATNIWTTKASMIDKRQDFKVEVVDGKIYAIGGTNGVSFFDSVEEYDPAINTCTTKAAMAQKRFRLGVAVVNGKIYAIGGGISDAQNTVEEYTVSEISIAPPILSALPGNSRIDLVWDAIDGASGYNVKRSETSGGPYTTIVSNITTTSYTDTAVTNGTTYYYVVTVLGPSGESANSNEAAATPQPPLSGIPSNLAVSPGNSRIDLAWDAVDGAAGYNVKRSETAGGPYATIAADVTAASYTDITVSNGTTYYYVVTALSEGFESTPSNEASATPENSGVSLNVHAADKANTGTIITVDIVINNAANICAEDFRFNYDMDLLEYMGATAADGIKIYNEAYIGGSTYRYITASLGKENAANGEKVLLHLKFKTKQAGQAKIDITRGRIADNAALEMDVADEACGEKIILIEGRKDVNRSGEFTLLDLGIDAWYFGSLASETDTEKYDADLDLSGQIDDIDLTAIVAEILLNENYTGNH